jgi:NDP-sugar pyrophosphorylase family protein
MNLPVAILAGGLATRLRPLTQKIPKALIDIHGVPFIQHQLCLLKSHGLYNVIICCGYLGDMIRNYIGDGNHFGMQVKYSTDGPRLLGTAGAIKRALPLLGESFFILYGDSYLLCDFKAVQEKFRLSAKKALMTVFRNKGDWDRSNVEFSNGQIEAYDKLSPTPQMQHIDYGLGVFRSDAFDIVPPDTEYDLARLYQLLLEQRELTAFEVRERFYEIGSMRGLEETRQFLKGHYIMVNCTENYKEEKWTL